MKPFQRLVEAAMAHSRLAIIVMVLLTAVVGSGAPAIEEESSLDQFQSDSTEAQKLEYLEENFTTGRENTTTAQVIVTGDNVLSKQSLLTLLEYERRIRAIPEIQRTLVKEDAVFSIANVVAIAAIQRVEGRELQRLVAELNRSRAALAANQSRLENRSQEVNETMAALRAALTRLREDPNANVSVEWDRVRANSSIALDDEDFRTFQTAADQLRSATNESAVEAAYELGTAGVLADELSELEQRSDRIEAEGEAVRSLAETVQRQRQIFRNASTASLAEQRRQLRSMNDSAIEGVVSDVLSETDQAQVLGLMPTDYEPGATQAAATVIVVVHRMNVNSVASGAASERIVDAQLAMQSIQLSTNLEFAVFGAGIINHEIQSSQDDSLRLVSPLALLFVLAALTIAYRDVLDILLGLVGIGAVLLWAFGFMGWVGISFNQIFVALPVLLIGLSIDYAIHIFMRHREERSTLLTDEENAADGTRPSMRVALGGVGVALLWVTATTVIGFLSNLVSPVEPIRQFGLVSAFGITAALLIFGILVPAVKVELDEGFEALGLERHRPAFGTGGGRLGNLLSLGAYGARRAPVILILSVVVISTVSAIGGAQVDTSFEERDFLADDPPAYMDRLPEPIRPGDYSAKENLETVNSNFVRANAQAQILVEGDVTDQTTLEAIAAAQRAAASKPVTQNLSNGEPDLRTPLSVMRSVAKDNATFEQTFREADSDNDGIPEENLTGLYDALFRIAPQEAVTVIHREDGEYRALRLVVSIRGNAAGDAVTTQMRAVADEIETTGSDLTATATGNSVLNELVQDELLKTVIQSLLVTLVAVFLFLMGAYRLTNGSATLGLVTLLPVVFSVTWILGTMFILGIPFNVLTGMITSLTIGLGVAYSIHISERYTQELDRSSSVWEAMTTATTGTGGALLGSAATTVGGFGVLVFAILPPLEQFGIITGLTIIYAFLAAVVVLPSLLVGWTAVVGPPPFRSEVRREVTLVPFGRGDHSRQITQASDKPVTEDEATDVSTDGAEVDQTSGRIEPSQGTTGTSGDIQYQPIECRRSVSPKMAIPGETVLVTVELSNLPDRAILAESFEGAISLKSIRPDPIEVATRNGRMYVLIKDTTHAVVQYAATVSPATSVEPMFSGRVISVNGDAPVTGVQRLTLIESVFERVEERGIVTTADLSLAGDQFADGTLSPEQFEELVRRWLNAESAANNHVDGNPDPDTIRGGPSVGPTPTPDFESDSENPMEQREWRDSSENDQAEGPSDGDSTSEPRDLERSDSGPSDDDQRQGDS